MFIYQNTFIHLFIYSFIYSFIHSSIYFSIHAVNKSSILTKDPRSSKGILYHWYSLVCGAGDGARFEWYETGNNTKRQNSIDQPDGWPSYEGNWC